jgi:hypothetical protein
MVHFGWFKTKEETNTFGTTKAGNPVLQRNRTVEIVYDGYDWKWRAITCCNAPWMSRLLATIS